MKAIEGIGITKAFGNPPSVILKGINVSIDSGSFTALIGKSGSGKSTLLYILSGLDNPTSGQVFMDGVNFFELDSIAMHKFRNEKMGFVFQFHYLLPELTAFDNVLMASRKKGITAENKEHAAYLLEEFGLTHCREKFPSQMSGGEQQRVAIARALSQKPKLLFADEPTGNLDTTNGDKVMEIFRKINKEDKTTILIVTHDSDYANSVGQRIHLQDGLVVKIN